MLSSKLTKSAPITSLHTMSPADKALERSRAVRRVLGGLLVANIAVLITKATIGTLAGSLAVLGDALHSSVDAVYNVLGLVVVRVAAKEPDEDHPYGHGKFATLATNIVVAWYENRRGHELSSELLIADAAHTRTDVFITIGVLIGVLLSRRGLTWVDPVVA